MINENEDKTEPTCCKCGGPVAQTDVLAGAGPLAVAKVRSALSLGITRGSPLSAKVCTTCGCVELYAANPEVLR